MAPLPWRGRRRTRGQRAPRSRIASRLREGPRRLYEEAEDYGEEDEEVDEDVLHDPEEWAFFCDRPHPPVHPHAEAA